MTDIRMPEKRRLQVVVCGGGIAGMTLSLALARRGQRVTLIERDATPRPELVTDAAGWHRTGVAQLHQPHAFLARIHAELRAELPDILDAFRAAGALDADLPGGLRSFWARRGTVEWALRRQVEAEPGVHVRIGAVSAVEASGGRAVGVRLDSGTLVPADLVVDCGGRWGRVTSGLAEDAVDEPADEVYHSRRYRLRPGRHFAPVNRGVIGVEEADGYALLIFPHDAGTFTTVFTRLPDDTALAALSGVAAFEAAARAVPLGAAWTDPEFAEPISGVTVMGGLRNIFRPLGPGAPLGLHTVGDSLCVTNPHFGRGSSLAVAHAVRLARAVAEDPADPAAWRERVDAWVAGELRVWFDECRAIDTARAAAWREVMAGGAARPVPPGAGPRPAGTGSLPRFMFLAAAGADPDVGLAVFRHMHLADPPELLDELAPRVLELFGAGWRPSRPPGVPSRADLVAAIAAAARPLGEGLVQAG
jgi:2-polyprenyl-6-methoxyphenol hydroxylase-like FAD-dependent oxidoreductase